MSPELINNTRLFKRLSQIIGIPVRDIKPARMNRLALRTARKKEPQAFKPGEVHGYYEHTTHSTVLPGLLLRQSNPRKVTIRHEDRHGIQKLLGPQTVHRLDMERPKSMPDAYRIQAKRAAETTFAEATNPVGREPAEASLDGVERKKFLASQENPFIKWIDDWAGFYAAKGFNKLVAERHGADGVLLMYATPPIDAKGIPDITQVWDWEKNMVRQNILYEKGGLTPKGLRFFREKIQPATVWQRLAKMRKNRGRLGRFLYKEPRKPVRAPQRRRVA